MTGNIPVLVVGFGNMGLAHALCYQTLNEVVRATTSIPGVALGRPDIGTLPVGDPGDSTVFEIEAGVLNYEDAPGEHMLGDRRIKPRMLVNGGRV